MDRERDDERILASQAHGVTVLLPGQRVKHDRARRLCREINENLSIWTRGDVLDAILKALEDVKALGIQKKRESVDEE